MNVARPQSVQAIKDEIAREQARRNLLRFALRMRPNYAAPPHIRLLIEKLEAIERGDLKRLLVTLPVRHGKTTVLNLFAAWLLGRADERGAPKKIISASYAERLALSNSQATRMYLQAAEWPFRNRLHRDVAAADRWLTKGGSEYNCIGVEGGISGHGADVMVLDDILAEGSNAGDRQRAMAWYQNVAVQRLQSDSAVVCIGTRQTEDDFFGQLFGGPGGAQWDHVRLPIFAEAEGDDPLGRAPGELLWPGLFSREEIEARKVEIGSVRFEAFYQQNPLPATGNIFRREWLGARYDGLPPFERVIAAVDPASGTALTNDFSAIVVLGVAHPHTYVLDVIRKRVPFTELVREIEGVAAKWGAQPIYIESSSNGIAALDVLARDTRLPIKGVVPRGNKTDRVTNNATPPFEAGRVLLPREASWLAEFERELLGFPNVKHDDQVDALALALAQVGSGRGRFSFAFVPTSTW